MRGSTGPVRSISSTTDRSACWLACEAPPVAQTAKGERTSNSAANARRARRLLPLAALRRLSMVFPDRAPSRFGVALRAGTVRHLEERFDQVREAGVDDEPSQAARQILELIGMLNAHDRGTRGHAERVRAFTDLLAEQMDLPPEDRDRLHWAALLHDVGKVMVPAAVLNKDGPPDDEE